MNKIDSYLKSLPSSLTEKLTHVTADSNLKQNVLVDLILEPWPLNEQQLRGFLHNYIKSRPLLLLAGAGSGKTAVMTRKIAWHVLEGIPVEKILALTFTRRAAREMKTRVVERLKNSRQYFSGANPKELDRVIEDFESKSWVTTFHSACWRILNQKLPGDGFRLAGRYNRALKDEITLLAPDERIKISYKISRRLGHSELTTEKVLEKARHHRDQFESSDRLIRESRSDLDYETARFMQKYRNFREKNNLVDLQDIITLPARLLRSDRTARRYLRGQFYCQLVDEFQDTSLAQLTFLSRMAGNEGSVCAVGDDFQAIYEWRGARPQLIRKFNNFFPEARKINLNYNYRSTGRILLAALELFSGRMIAENRDLHPTRRISKNKLKFGRKLVKFEARTKKEEVDYVSYEIRKLIEDGISPSEIAIFYRTQRQKFPFISTFKRKKIPFRVTGSKRFFNLRVPKTILNLANLMTDLVDIFNNPGPEGCNSGLHTELRLENWWRAACEIDLEEPVIPAPAIVVDHKRWEKFVLDLPPAARTEYNDIRQRLLEWTNHLKNGGKLVDLLPEIKHKLKLYRERKLIGQYRRFKKWLGDMDFAGGKKGTAEIINRAVLQGSFGADSLQKQEDKSVKLMTLHSCKGLEFKVVFMVGLSDNIIPGAAKDNGGKREEEKRLFYVGITRARDLLYFSYPLRSKNKGGWQKASRFLKQIPEEYLDTRKAPLSYSEKFKYLLGI